MLTINDVLEEIVGDIDADDHDDIVKRDDGSYSLDGTFSLARLNETIEQFNLPKQEVGNYQTIAGFVMARLGRLPEIADTFEYDGLHFEVADMDEARVDRVVITVPDIDETDTEPDDEQPDDNDALLG